MTLKLTEESIFEAELESKYQREKRKILSANAELERRVVQKRTRDFFKKINFRHHLYAITLTPEQSLLRNKEWFYPEKNRVNKPECKEHLLSLLDRMLFVFHRHCHNSFQRYQEKQTHYFVSDEYTDKRHTKLVTPHLHGVLAIHHSYLSNFESLLIPHPDPDHDSTIPTFCQKTIDFHRTDSFSRFFFESSIASIHLSKINPVHLHEWLAYCCKEEAHLFKLKNQKESNYENNKTNC